MAQTSKLAAELEKRHADWLRDRFPAQKDRFEDLVSNGQRPDYMVISCCDSRVQPEHIFQADPGFFFTHRNIANFVPRANAGDVTIGTAAALEYGVGVLGVKAILVMGHSKCGGIQGCRDACHDRSKSPGGAVQKWIDHIEPAFKEVRALSGDHQLEAMEKEAVRLSLKNLRSYAPIQEAMNARGLILIGCWYDISSGEVAFL